MVNIDFYISSSAYHWGTFEAGILAIFGLSGAVAAPIVGRLADSYSERKIVGMGLAMQTISFIALFIAGDYLVVLLLAIILLDVGNQFGQVANQTRVQGLGEAASNRNNTIFMFMYSYWWSSWFIAWYYNVATIWLDRRNTGWNCFPIMCFFFQYVVFREKRIKYPRIDERTHFQNKLEAKTKSYNFVLASLFN